MINNMQEMIDKTIESLKMNGFNVVFSKDKIEALDAVKQIVKGGDKIACGGSMTLKDSGILNFLKSDEFNFITDYTEALSADVYFSSSNAITLDGVLYNVDGRSNRVSAIAYGPKQVVIVAGINKIVPTLNDAVKRVKTIAAPKNCVRLSKKTYCAENGFCVCLAEKKDAPGMDSGCESKDRICRNYLVTAKQCLPGRITVVLVNEALGY